jgi:hypothetical protein
VRPLKYKVIIVTVIVIVIRRRAIALTCLPALRNAEKLKAEGRFDMYRV